LRAEKRHRSQAVLVVEDETDVRELTADVIASTGRTVFTARSGVEALRLLDHSEIPRPCLILLDWLMAPMCGEEFLVRLNTREDAPELPVLVLSAHANVPPETITASVLGTLRKPFEVEELNRVLEEYC
jgi:CheY-like chemotaxis protein